MQSRSGHNLDSWKTNQCPIWCQRNACEWLSVGIQIHYRKCQWEGNSIRLFDNIDCPYWVMLVGNETISSLPQLQYCSRAMHTINLPKVSLMVWLYRKSPLNYSPNTPDLFLPLHSNHAECYICLFRCITPYLLPLYIAVLLSCLMYLKTLPYLVPLRSESKHAVWCKVCFSQLLHRCFRCGYTLCTVNWQKFTDFPKV